MRSALHVLCRTSCFLALKLHVLLVGFFSLVCRVFIWLQLLNNVRWGVLALLYVIRKPENMVVLECMFCSELWFSQTFFSDIPPHELHMVFNHIINVVRWHIQYTLLSIISNLYNDIRFFCLCSLRYDTIVFPGTFLTSFVIVFCPWSAWSWFFTLYIEQSQLTL